MDGIHSIRQLALRVGEDPELAKALQEHPAETLAQLAIADQSDNLVYRLVVLMVAVVALVAISLSVYIELVGKTVPDVLVAVGSTAVGAMAGILAPSPTNKL